MGKLRKLFDMTVFRRQVKGGPLNDYLAALFHRSAATLYLIYSVWGFAAIVSGIPSISRAQSELWQFLFAVALFLVCVPACIAATFFPRWARLELLAGGSFCGLVIVYLVILFRDVFFVGEASFAGAIALTSLLVIPLARTIFVYVSLLWQADARQPVGQSEEEEK